MDFSAKAYSVRKRKWQSNKNMEKNKSKKISCIRQLYRLRKHLHIGTCLFILGCIFSILFLVFWYQQIYSVKAQFHHMTSDCSLAEIRAVDNDMKCFPVRRDVQKKEHYAFDNSYGGVRTYGGRRQHEGIDIMTSNDRSGYFKIQSATDGVVEQIGWLRLGGYRLGIRSQSGFYYYYAHMKSYAPGIKKGKKLKAGTVLGTMGDTGYGKEGTHGRFAVHLHFGIYRDKRGEERSLNPYDVLLKLK